MTDRKLLIELNQLSVTLCNEGMYDSAKIVDSARDSLQQAIELLQSYSGAHLPIREVKRVMNTLEVLHK